MTSSITTQVTEPEMKKKKKRSVKQKTTTRRTGWICPDCGEMQSNSSAACKKCKLPKPPSWALGVPSGGFLIPDSGSFSPGLHLKEPSLDRSPHSQRFCCPRCSQTFDSLNDLRLHRVGHCDSSGANFEQEFSLASSAGTSGVGRNDAANDAASKVGEDKSEKNNRSGRRASNPSARARFDTAAEELRLFGTYGWNKGKFERAHAFVRLQQLEFLVSNAIEALLALVKARDACQDNEHALSADELRENVSDMLQGFGLALTRFRVPATVASERLSARHIECVNALGLDGALPKVVSMELRMLRPQNPEDGSGTSVDDRRNEYTSKSFAMLRSLWDNAFPGRDIATDLTELSSPDFDPTGVVDAAVPAPESAEGAEAVILALMRLENVGADPTVFAGGLAGTAGTGVFGRAAANLFRTVRALPLGSNERRRILTPSVWSVGCDAVARELPTAGRAATLSAQAAFREIHEWEAEFATVASSKLVAALTQNLLDAGLQNDAAEFAAGVADNIGPDAYVPRQWELIIKAMLSADDPTSAANFIETLAESAATKSGSVQISPHLLDAVFFALLQHDIENAVSFVVNRKHFLAPLTVAASVSFLCWRTAPPRWVNAIMAARDDSSTPFIESSSKNERGDNTDFGDNDDRQVNEAEGHYPEDRDVELAMKLTIELTHAINRANSGTHGCFRCGSLGHAAKMCPVRTRDLNPVTRQRVEALQYAVFKVLDATRLVAIRQVKQSATKRYDDTLPSSYLCTAAQSGRLWQMVRMANVAGVPISSSILEKMMGFHGVSNDVSAMRIIYEMHFFQMPVVHPTPRALDLLLTSLTFVGDLDSAQEVADDLREFRERTKLKRGNRRDDLFEENQKEA